MELRVIKWISETSLGLILKQISDSLNDPKRNTSERSQRISESFKQKAKMLTHPSLLYLNRLRVGLTEIALFSI